jgi:hypothetical protein
MWRCSAILLLGGLLACPEVAGAQDAMVTHWLTVSVHPVVHLNQPEVEGILKGASDLLQGNNTDITPRNNCKVEFKFKGFIPWTSAPAVIASKTELEQVHEVAADVKIVRSIRYCRQRKGLYWGCAWRPGDLQRTVIISSEGISAVGGPVVLAHEYGHTTGLPHRRQVNNLNLMAPCPEAFSQQVNQHECTQFLKGPMPPPYPPILSPACTDNSSARHPID